MIKKITFIAVIVMSIAMCAFATDSSNLQQKRTTQSNEFEKRYSQQDNAQQNTAPEGDKAKEEVPSDNMPQNAPNPPGAESSGEPPYGRPPMPSSTQVDGEFPMPPGGGRGPGSMGHPGSMPTETTQPRGSEETDSIEPTEIELGFWETYSTPIFSVLLLGFAFLFVIFYKRKNF